MLPTDEVAAIIGDGEMISFIRKELLLLLALSIIVRLLLPPEVAEALLLVPKNSTSLLRKADAGWVNVLVSGDSFFLRLEELELVMLVAFLLPTVVLLVFVNFDLLVVLLAELMLVFGAALDDAARLFWPKLLVIVVSVSSIELSPPVPGKLNELLLKSGIKLELKHRW